MLTYMNQGVGIKKDQSDNFLIFVWAKIYKYRMGLSSSIRTITVGSGITPDLLTSIKFYGALAGFPDHSGIPPVGNFTPP
jgi:hypothetical protein